MPPHSTARLKSCCCGACRRRSSNVRKHASARRVTVRVGSSDGSIDVEVRDDGRGFDIDAARAGFGLDGMRERVGARGWHFRGGLTAERRHELCAVRLPQAAAAAEGAR